MQTERKIRDLTGEEIAALWAFAQSQGRTWKAELTDVSLTGPEALEVAARKIDALTGQLDGHAFAAGTHGPLLMPADVLMELRRALVLIDQARKLA